MHTPNNKKYNIHHSTLPYFLKMNAITYHRVKKIVHAPTKINSFSENVTQLNQLFPALLLDRHH